MCQAAIHLSRAALRLGARGAALLAVAFAFSALALVGFPARAGAAAQGPPARGTAASAGPVTPPAPGASTRAEAEAPVRRWRSVLQEVALGETVLEPVPVGDTLLVVALEPSPSAGRLAGPSVDLDLVRRHPASAAYYLWRILRRAGEAGIAVADALVIFPGEPQVVARLRQGSVGTGPKGGGPSPATAASLQRSGPTGSVSAWEAPFDPEGVSGWVEVRVDGAPWKADSSAWARAADALTLQADLWLGRYRPQASLGNGPDVSSLLRAQRLYEAALDVAPAHRQASSRLAQVEAKLQAALLLSRALAIVHEHERALRDADRRHDEAAARRLSFYLGHAADLIQVSLRLDRSLMAASAALERVRRLLGERSLVSDEAAADLQAQLLQAYKDGARELAVGDVLDGVPASPGLRVHLRGRVVAQEAGAMVVAAQAPSGETSGATGSGAPSSHVYVWLVEPASRVAAPLQAGAWVDVWGELAGTARYRGEGGPRALVRVLAAYVLPAREPAVVGGRAVPPGWGTGVSAAIRRLPT